MDELHQLQGAIAVACFTIGAAFFLLGLAEWLEHRKFKKQKEKQSSDL